MDKEKEPKNTKKFKIIINILVSIILICAIIATLFFIKQMEDKKNSAENTLAYTELVNEIKNGNIEKIEMKKKKKLQ